MNTTTAYGQTLTESEIALLEEANALYAQADTLLSPTADMRKREELLRRASTKVSEATTRAYYESFRSASQPHITK